MSAFSLIKSTGSSLDSPHTADGACCRAARCRVIVLADTGSHALVAAASVIVLHGALAAQQIGRRDELAGLELRRATAQLGVVRDVHDDFVELYHLFSISDNMQLK